MAEPPPSDNLFLSELPAAFTEEQLRSIFGAYGNIAQAKLMPGQGKNNALVRFATQDEAVWVKDNLNGNIPQGMTTPVNVKYANPPWSKGKGKDGGKGWSDGGKGWAPYDNGGKGKGWDDGKGWGKGKDGGKGKGKSIKGLKKGLIEAGALPGGKWSNDENALFIAGLPSDTTTEDLYEIFSPFGAIPARGCKAMTGDDGSCKGIGFVNYVDSTAVQNAIMTLNGTQMPDGTILKVSIKAEPSANGGKNGGKDGGKGKGKW
mmetsp:Transcript_30019/g.67655  ORF Transcript_30019/g.67655 Transcript_30019/m.67655 type:complete len:261 (-) Transcript_30019:117-899(-)